MMRPRLVKAACLLVLLAPAGFLWPASESSTGCESQAPAPRSPDRYPAHPLSPSQSLQHFDVVFWAEVLVPSRSCSLGYCAGLRSRKVFKGRLPDANVLVQVRRPTGPSCTPRRFEKKGSNWLVFGNKGTSNTGFFYVSSTEEAPSFPASKPPRFPKLTHQYRQWRAQLDQAISKTLPRHKLQGRLH